ncbi:MAG: hypothetical protein AB6733_18155 [Clostridiaceae bacterium]
MSKKNESRPITLDPAVADLLAGMEKRQSESQLPRQQRERLVKQRIKIQARREQRATYDLPPSIRESIRLISEDMRIPASQIVTLALIRFLKSYAAEEIDLAQFKQPSRSPRYDWNLVLTKEIQQLPKKK